MTNANLTTGIQMTQFIGRKRELEQLETRIGRKHAQLIILKGRRRIGKSRLLFEFGQKIGKAHLFAGLAPEKNITAQDQRNEFARVLHVEFGLRSIKTDDWGDLFWHLAEVTKTESCLIIFDEISWMAHEDPTFLPKLKNAWDLYFKQNPRLILAICGSISLWIEKNILSSTGFLGRQSLNMTLEEMPLVDCVKFWDHSHAISAQEKLLMLAVTGGIPRYLEEIDPALPSVKNIEKLCFNSSGILFTEFNQIFSDLFSSDKPIYQEIVSRLADGPQEAKPLLTLVGLHDSGRQYEHLENLVEAGFLSQDYTWKIKDGNVSKLSQYRLRDNYCRFYLKYILPNALKIKSGNFEGVSLTALPNWSTVMGLQFENLVLSNRKLIKQALGLNPQEIVLDNPFFQRPTKRHAGCQIDYLIQTSFNNLYVCEIRYSKNPIELSIIAEVQEKIKRLVRPKDFSIRPILIHCNQVSTSVEESHYFAKIIDFTDFLR